MYWVSAAAWAPAAALRSVFPLKISHICMHVIQLSLLYFWLSQYPVVVYQSIHDHTIKLDYYITFYTYFNGQFSYLVTKRYFRCPWLQQKWLHCKNCWQQKPWEQKEHRILPPQAPRRPCNIKRWLATMSMFCFFSVIDSDRKTNPRYLALRVTRVLEPITAFQFITGPPRDKQLITLTVQLHQRSFCLMCQLLQNQTKINFLSFLL